MKAYEFCLSLLVSMCVCRPVAIVLLQLQYLERMNFVIRYMDKDRNARWLLARFDMRQCEMCGGVSTVCSPLPFQFRCAPHSCCVRQVFLREVLRRFDLETEASSAAGVIPWHGQRPGECLLLPLLVLLASLVQHVRSWKTLMSLYCSRSRLPWRPSACSISASWMSFDGSFDSRGSVFGL